MKYASQKAIFSILSLFFVVNVQAFGSFCSGTCKANAVKTGSGSLGELLTKMEIAAKDLKTLSGDLEYLFIQDPELLDARTLRKGNLYYRKDDGRSRLRISFVSVQQDDETPRIEPEHYLFDGVWLTKVDTKLETVDLYQEAPEDKPADVFELISKRFPMVGFSDPNNLEKEFVITLKNREDSESPYHLHLAVKKESSYKDDYKEIEVWVNRKTFLPQRITAVSVQGDFFELKWINLRINKKLPKDAFEVEIPENFSKTKHPLEK